MLPWITPEASAATNGHTRDEAVAEARRRAQNPYDYDGVYGPQCVDLIWWYYQYLGYRSPGGDATAYMNNQLPNNEWKRYTPDETIPQPGDIVVFKAGHKYSYKDIYGNPCYAGITGHIAIVVESNSSWYKLVEFNGTSFTTNYNYPLWDFSCVIRPDWPSSQPTAPSVNLGNDFFAYIRHTHSGYNLENNSFNVQLASSNSKEPRQIWHFMRQADNSYKIVNMYDGLYLEVANAGTAWGTNVQVMTGDNNPNNAQKWLICGPNAYSNMFYLAPGLSKDHTLVLDVAGGDSAIFPGQNICINKSWYGLEGSGHINNGPFHQAQTFQIQKISGNIGTQLSYNMGSDFYARVGHNGHYIEASGVVTESGSNMDVQSSGIYQNNPKQIWHFIRQSNGTYKAVNEYSGWCLDVSSFAANNVKVRMWYIDNGTPAQQWYPIKSRGESTYRLASALLYPWNGEHALFSLTMPLSISGSVLSGTKPVIRQQSHEANQHFNITTASYTRPGAPSAPQNIRVNATSSGTTITWDPVPEVNGFDEREYFVYLIGDGPVSDIAFTQTVPTASCTSSVVLEPGPYVVGVRARNVKYPKTSTNYQSAVSTLFTDILSTYTVDVNAAEGGTAGAAALTRTVIQSPLLRRRKMAITL